MEQKEENLVNVKEELSQVNGCSCPFHPYQLISIIGFAINTCIYYIIFVPSVNSNIPGMIIAIIINSILTILVLAFGLIATVIDSRDPTVNEERIKHANNVSIDSNDFEFYCKLCKTHVLERTKHCGACNKCVLVFDHHCKWLNNCIGEKNYRYFISLIISVELLNLNQIGSSLAFIILFFHGYCRDNLIAVYQKDIGIFAIIIIFILIIDNFVFLCFISHLIFFHIRLYKNNMTTYEYIINKRNIELAKKDPKSGPYTSKFMVNIKKEKENRPSKVEKELIECSPESPPQKHLTDGEEICPKENWAPKIDKEIKENQNDFFDKNKKITERESIISEEHPISDHNIIKKMNSVVSCEIDNSMISEPQKSKSITKSINKEGKIESVVKEKNEDQKEQLKNNFSGGKNFVKMNNPELIHQSSLSCMKKEIQDKNQISFNTKNEYLSYPNLLHQEPDKNNVHNNSIPYDRINIRFLSNDAKEIEKDLQDKIECQIMQLVKLKMKYPLKLLKSRLSFQINSCKILKPEY